TNQAGVIDKFNQAAQSMFGYQRGEVKGQPFHCLLALPKGEAPPLKLEELVKGQKFRPLELGSGLSQVKEGTKGARVDLGRNISPTTVLFRRVQGGVTEFVGRRKDGSLFPLELSVSEVALNKQRSFTIIARDITERKKAEDQIRQLNQELEARVQR